MIKRGYIGWRLVTLAALLLLACGSGLNAASLVPGEEWPELLIGKWTGNWSSDFYERSGSVTLDLRTNADRRITGSGQSVGGVCDQPFHVAGRFGVRDIRIRIRFDQEDCGEVGFTGTMGRDDDGDLIMVGHWQHIIGGQAAGRNFGLLVLNKAG